MDVDNFGLWVEADPETWIPVPLEFPTGPWPYADAWVADISQSLREALTLTDAVAADIRLLVADIVAMPSPVDGALFRFWYFPHPGRPIQFAHLYTVPRAEVGDADLAEIGLRGPYNLQPQRIEEVTSAAFERAIRIFAVGSLAGEGADETAVAAVRFVGESAGVVFMLEVLGTELTSIAQMTDDLAALFDSVHFGSSDEFGQVEGAVSGPPETAA